MNSREATNAGVQALANSVAQERDTIQNSMQQFNKIPEAYDKAPIYGRIQGAAYGIPAGLMVGGLTYGVTSLLPWIRKRKGLKAVLSLLAATAGGIAIGKPIFQRARDLYFEDQTGVPSPWKTYTLNNKNNTTVRPSDLIDSYREAWAKAKDDPLGYFKNKLVQDIHSQRTQGSFSDISQLADTYAKAWQQFKSDPASYLRTGYQEGK